jgi:predicted acylesterase/phospholipase RssA
MPIRAPNKKTIVWTVVTVAVAAAVLGLVATVRSDMTTRREAVPAALSIDAKLVGYTERVRYFPRDATHVKEFEQDYLASLNREKAELRRQGFTGDNLPPGTDLPPASFLVLSGGGDGGAFGAGVLNGWTRTGKRPVFKLVTGVSTGALIAPFAFLGPSYDAQMKRLYTKLSFTDVARMRWFASALYTDALADTTPLQRLIEKNVTQLMLDEIAVEHAKGRILLIATANLDVRRPVIWNVTEIAALRHPDALKLVHKILIASSAIPGTFPPVMFDVEAGGKRYEEMHVDGGTASQLFMYPAAIQLRELATRERNLYIIRNARLDPDWAQVDRRTLPIAMRAISTLIHNQGLGDLYRVYAIAQRDHIDFNLTFIPPSFKVVKKRDFDTKFMQALFETGERLGAEGVDWLKRPPVLLSGVDEDAPSDTR